jgi:hypothetical protein
LFLQFFSTKKTGGKYIGEREMEVKESDISHDIRKQNFFFTFAFFLVSYLIKLRNRINNEWNCNQTAYGIFQTKPLQNVIQVLAVSFCPVLLRALISLLKNFPKRRSK